jgi:hypothetical protein
MHDVVEGVPPRPGDIVCGIDPGLDGAMAFLDAGSQRVVAMIGVPTLVVGKGSACGEDRRSGYSVDLTCGGARPAALSSAMI